MISQDIIFTYPKTSMSEIAEALGVTRQRVWQIIREHGIDTSSRKSIKVKCSCCGVSLERNRKKAEKKKHHFCSRECYYVWLGEKKEEPWKQRLRKARLDRGLSGKPLWEV